MIWNQFGIKMPYCGIKEKFYYSVFIIQIIQYCQLCLHIVPYHFVHFQESSQSGFSKKRRFEILRAALSKMSIFGTKRK